MIKKTFTLLVFILACINLCGCGDDTETSGSDPKDELTLGAETLNYTHEGQPLSDTSFSVTSNGVWNAGSDSGWCEIAPADGIGDGTITVSVSANPDHEQRQAIVTVTRGSMTEKVTVIQEAKPQPTAADISLSSDDDRVEIGEDGTSGTIIFLSGGGEIAVSVESSLSEWEAFSSNEGWCGVTREGNLLTITAKENATIYEQTSTVTVQTGTQGNSSVAVLEVSQKPLKDNMILEIYVHDGEGGTDNNMILPLDHTSSGALVNVVIDWGDGSKPERYVTGYPEHSYDQAGTYEVSILGTVTTILGNYVNYFPTIYRPCIKKVKQWGNLGLVNMKYGFYYFDGIEEIAAPEPETFAKLESIYSCFERCVNLKTIPAGLFENASALNETYAAFSGCESLEEIPDRVFANCAAVTRFSMAFKNCKAATSVGNDVFKGCGGATAILQCFYGCESLESVPETIFDDLKEMTDFSYIFGNCTALESIPANLFKNNSKANNLSSAFAGCTGLLSIPEALFSSNLAATNLSSAFSGCTQITSVPEKLFEKNTAVTNFGNLFANCTALKTVPERLFANNKATTSYAGMFSGCTALESVPEKLFDGHTAVTSYANLMKGCTAISSIPAGLFASAGAVTNFSAAFQGCSELAAIPATLFSNAAAATNYSNIFRECPKITSIPAELFAASPGVTNFNSSFMACTGITSIPASLFDANTKVTNFGATFSGCSALSGESPYTDIGGSIHLYQRETLPGSFTKPTAFTGCFKGCTGLSDYAAIQAGYSKWVE